MSKNQVYVGVAAIILLGFLAISLLLATGHSELNGADNLPVSKSVADSVLIVLPALGQEPSRAVTITDAKTATKLFNEIEDLPGTSPSKTGEYNCPGGPATDIPYIQATLDFYQGQSFFVHADYVGSTCKIIQLSDGSWKSVSSSTIFDDIQKLVAPSAGLN